MAEWTVSQSPVIDPLPDDKLEIGIIRRTFTFFFGKIVSFVVFTVVY